MRAWGPGHDEHVRSGDASDQRPQAKTPTVWWLTE
jgi:hypothetical protein